MTPEVLFENISHLPPNARQEIYDFIDFLVFKYKDTIPDEKFELSEKGKKFIDQRIELMQSNPEKLSYWTNVKERLAQKNNW